MLAILGPGRLRIGSPGAPEVVAEVGEGFLSVEHDRVTVVADTAALLTSSSTR
jgi:F0F1-type ATP synthase epsilon subunit